MIIFNNEQYSFKTTKRLTVFIDFIEQFSSRSLLSIDNVRLPFIKIYYPSGQLTIVQRRGGNRSESHTSPIYIYVRNTPSAQYSYVYNDIVLPRVKDNFNDKQSATMARIGEYTHSVHIWFPTRRFKHTCTYIANCLQSDIHGL